MSRGRPQNGQPRHLASLAEMNHPFNCIRWWLWLIVGWVFSAILCAELLGYPHVYGWPLWIVRVEEAPPPSTWVVLANLLFAMMAVGATILVARWCSRIPAGRIQFRLSTLMGLVAVVAVLLGAWRANIQYHDLLSSGKRSEDHPAELFTFFIVNLTCEYGHRPIWMRGPLSLFIRLGVLLGLACSIYSAGRFAVQIVERLMRRKPKSPE